MEIAPGLAPLMLFLVPAILLLGAVTGIWIRKHKPASQGRFSTFYAGFLCGVLALYALSFAAQWFGRVAESFLAADPEVVSIGYAVLAALGGFFVLAGIVTLVAAQVAPRLLESPFLRWLTMGSPEQPCRNRTMMGVSAMLMGAYFMLVGTGYFWLGFAAFLLSLPITRAAQRNADPSR